MNGSARESTSVAIVGAGPAGLTLGHILAQAGVPFRIIERTTREHLLGRVRAGVLEQGTVDLLASLGLDADLRRRGLTHHGIYLQYEGRRHHVDFDELVGRTVTVYGQQALVAHLLAEHDRIGSDVRFETTGMQVDGLTTSSPTVHYVDASGPVELSCDVVVGADGYHGIGRQSLPAASRVAWERAYPYAWLGILADVEPSTDDLIYALHRDGFAMHSMRSREVSRLYLQVAPDESIDDWSDGRIWEALQTRLGVDGWTLAEGAVTEKSITPMRSFVASCLSHGRLFLAGDAGHIVPPTGAKGLNSAVADVALLGRALLDHRAGDDTGLATYSERALARQWKVQQFSQWMTQMLHVHDDGDASERGFAYRSQVGQLEYVTRSRAAQQSLAEQYAGLPFSEGAA
ncbi:4-hydroxybenzoate 3-monooxygenase [Cellulomonas sp. McL0617]|uniref:4-hydroxybenzoate 3-monooxygenase n=1 Tax=Cellulomonas sp. McL0617 TaxID=3415675 RepID=UPI003CF85F43